MLHSLSTLAAYRKPPKAQNRQAPSISLDIHCQPPIKEKCCLAHEFLILLDLRPRTRKEGFAAMANVTQKDLIKAKSIAERMQRRFENAKEKGEEVVGSVVQTAEVGATAFAFGYARGRYGETNVMGVPIDLGAGAATHLGAFFGLFGKYAEHAHNLADGAIAEYLAVKGAIVGDKMRQKAGNTGLGQSIENAVNNVVKTGGELPAPQTSVAMHEINAAVEAATRAATGR